MILLVVLVIIGVEMVSVERREDVVVMNWPVIEVTVVANDGAVVMDVVVVVIKVMVMRVVVEVVEGEVQRAVHPQKE